MKTETKIAINRTIAVVAVLLLAAIVGWQSYHGQHANQLSAAIMDGLLLVLMFWTSRGFGYIDGKLDGIKEALDIFYDDVNVEEDEPAAAKPAQDASAAKPDQVNADVKSAPTTRAPDDR